MKPLELRAVIVNYCAARGCDLDVAWAIAGMTIEDFDPDVSDEHGLLRLYEGVERLIGRYTSAGE